MLIKRILTAAVGIPAAVYIIHAGEWLFAMAVIVLALLAWREYVLMLHKKSIEIGMLSGAVVTLLLLLCAWCGNSEETLMALWLALVLVLIRTLKRWQEDNPPFAAAAFNLFGIIYIGFSFIHLILLRQINTPSAVITGFGSLSAGAIYIWVAFLGTWASDTFAYFIGTAFGRHKLAPSISPHKSVEGVIGGLIGAILAVTIFGYYSSIAISHSLTMGAIVGLVAPLGDLAESALKRYCGVKDSGALLPGHGGVLDRFDSILFSVPAVYYYIKLAILQ